MWLWFGTPTPRWEDMVRTGSEVPVPAELCALCHEAFEGTDFGVIVHMTIRGDEQLLPVHIECLTAWVHPMQRPALSPFTLREWGRQLLHVVQYEGAPQEWAEWGQ